MITGPRYKKARRFGTSIFDKTQTQKYALRAQRKSVVARPKSKSVFASQLIEKQKARFTYGIGENQFRKYVKNILDKKGVNDTKILIYLLENRLDNVVYRIGFASTRQASRQMVNHGHINVNGKRVSIPSYQVKVGDVISIRESSKAKDLFKNLDEKMKDIKLPSWLLLDSVKKEVKIQGAPNISPTELSFNISAIFQYYSR